MGVPTTRLEDDDQVAIATPHDERAAHRGSWRTALRRPRSLHSPRRPTIWFEIALIALSYWIYSLVRNAVPEHETQAQNHAQWIWDVQSSLGLAFEHSVNHAVNSVTWLVVGMNYYYATLHFIVTIAVLVWLYRWQPGRYACARTVLFATTAVALVGYYFYPLAPPRLMEGMDFVDTVVVHGTWGSMASGDMANVSNQYAAMPSMHIGWSAWCGVIVLLLAKRRWIKALGVLYPLVTLVVIVATANHFWLDAVGGLLCLGFGFGVAYWWYRAHPHQLSSQVHASDAETAGSAPRSADTTDTATATATAPTSATGTESADGAEAAEENPDVPHKVNVPAPGAVATGERARTPVAAGTPTSPHHK